MGKSNLLYLDFEFQPRPGELPVVHCVSWSWDGEKVRGAWVTASTKDNTGPPWGDLPERTVLVAHQAGAEILCLRALGWPIPDLVFDTYVETKVAANHHPKRAWVDHRKAGLLPAREFFNLTTRDSEHKKEMQKMAARGGPFTRTEQLDMKAYCNEDVEDTITLFQKVAAQTHWDCALARGHFQKVVVDMQVRGLAVDVVGLQELQENRTAIVRQLVDQQPGGWDIFRKKKIKGKLAVSFTHKAWLSKMDALEIDWLRCGAKGTMAKLEKEYFQKQVELYPEELGPWKKLLAEKKMLESLNLGVGADGRHRVDFQAFGTDTGRNNHPGKRYIFGASSWVRGYVMPPKGRAFISADWSRQEFAIAGVLSGDEHMLDTYRAEDPYMSFAIAAGAAPKGATKATHSEVRELYKIASLAVQYGQTPTGLARSSGMTVEAARGLLDHHRTVYWTYWEWVGEQLELAQFRRWQDTRYGWRKFTHRIGTHELNSAQNFLIQSTGGELMHMAGSLAYGRGLELVGTMHDSLMLECEDTQDKIDSEVGWLEKCMDEASQEILDGFILGVDVEVVHGGERFIKEDDREDWAWVQKQLTDLKGEMV